MTGDPGYVMGGGALASLEDSKDAWCSSSQASFGHIMYALVAKGIIKGNEGKMTSKSRARGDQR